MYTMIEVLQLLGGGIISVAEARKLLKVDERLALAEGETDGA